MLTPVLSEEGWVAVFVAMISGVGLEALRRKLPSRDTILQAERVAETSFRDQLLKRIDELNARVSTLEHSAAEWQKKYYEEHQARLATEQRVRDLEHEVTDLRERIALEERR